MSAGKKHIRKAILRNRRLLDTRVYQKRNEQLLQNVLKVLALYLPKYVHCFLPISANREPNTWPIVKGFVDKEIQMVVSATDFESQNMTHFLYTDKLVFEDDKFGIPTPVSGVDADLQAIDLVFIPLLAADKKGNRIGYGKGYYDRLLPEMRKDVLKVGLNLCPTFDFFPFAEEQDVPLDCLVTPFEIIHCIE